MWTKPTIKEVVKVGNRFAPAHNGKRIYDINKYCNNLINSHKRKLSDADFKATLQNGTKAQIQKVLNIFEVTNIQKKALMLTNAFTGCDATESDIY